MNATNKNIKPAKEQTAREAMSALDAVMSATRKSATSAAAKPTKWVGTVTVIESSIPAMVDLITNVRRSVYCHAIAKSVTALVQAGNGSHTFGDVGDVEEFDRQQVADTWLAMKGHTNTLSKTGFDETKVSRGNPRMGHVWGYAQLGLASWLDVSKSPAMEAWVARHCDDDGKCAFFKVS